MATRIRTHEERTKILNYAKRNGVRAASERFGVSTGAIYSWQRRLKPTRRGEGRARSAEVTKLRAEIKRVKTVNKRLREKLRKIRQIVKGRS